MLGEFFYEEPGQKIKQPSLYIVLHSRHDNSMKSRTRSNTMKPINLRDVFIVQYKGVLDVSLLCVDVSHTDHLHA